MAVTPMPPAAQIEIRPRPEPRSARSLASVATMRAPGAAEGGAPEALAAVGVGLPGLQRAEHLRGEGLVDLVDVEVLELEPGALEHARHRIRRCHEHALLRSRHAA